MASFLILMPVTATCGNLMVWQSPFLCISYHASFLVLSHVIFSLAKRHFSLATCHFYSCHMSFIVLPHIILVLLRIILVLPWEKLVALVPH